MPSAAFNSLEDGEAGGARVKLVFFDNDADDASDDPGGGAAKAAANRSASDGQGPDTATV